MNYSLKKAKELLEKEDGYTCVLCRDDIIYTDTRRGIAPMLSYLEDGIALSGFSAADRVVGKAAAFLFALAGVKEVYAKVMAKTAVAVLDQHRILYSYDVLADHIINRSKTDLCPMEKAVAELNDPDAAFLAVKETFQKLKEN